MSTDVIPETRYAKTIGGVHIAYQALGEGPIDLAFIPGFIGNIELLWEQPIVASFLRTAAFGPIAGASRTDSSSGALTCRRT